MLRADIESVLVSKEQIEQKITQLGTADHQRLSWEGDHLSL